MDGKGDVVARAEIETPGIVQKGFQDAFVALKAGGRIHVKVSFVLSEEERKKIEAMRAAALRKRKGFPPQSPKIRQHPSSTVKIMEIPDEAAEALNSTTKPSRKLDDESVKHPVVTPERKEPKTPTKASLEATAGKMTKIFQDQVTKGARQASMEDRSKKPEVENSNKVGEGNRHSSFGWFPAANKSLSKHVKVTEAEAAAEGSRWLEGLKRKTRNDQVRAARADEWLKSRDAPVPAERQVTGSAGIQSAVESSTEKSSSPVKSQKSLKQRLEEWKVKDLGPWKCSTRTKDCTSDSACRKSRWSLGNHNASMNSSQDRQSATCLTREEQNLMAAADRMWASTLSEETLKSSNSGREKQNHGGGLKAAVKQALSGAAAIAGAFSIWPRKASRKHERCHDGKTRTTALPGSQTSVVHGDGLVYSGQRLPMA